MEPKQFLHYQLTEYLGHGPLGHTYQAYDPGLERGVAVKILSPYAHGSDDLRHRWIILQERMRNQPDGPVSIFDWAADGDRQAVIREHIDGESLEERFIAGGVSYQAALSLLLHLAQQVRIIHRSDLVHGNLHPSNVIFDHAATPHLTDPLMPETVKLWLDDVVATRRLFVAPELLHGRTPDRRSDIFALGAITVYTMIGEAITRIPDFRLEKLGDALSAGEPNELTSRVHLPREVEMFLGMLLAQEPKERFADIDGLIATLNQVRNPERESSYLPKTKINPRIYLVITVITLVLVVMWIVIASLRP